MLSTTRRTVVMAVGLLAALLAASCSDTASTDAVQTTAVPRRALAVAHPACSHTPAPAPRVDPVSASSNDFTLKAFDGIKVRMHWFAQPTATAANPAPVVLMGPGWSLAGDSDPDAPGPFGGVNIKSLREAGYHVLTWDPRGFGQSEGQANVNDPDIEGNDVMALLDWVAENPAVATDAPGDPRVGMVGVSYGGGIQLTTAGIDCRVDAIVPMFGWNSLVSSLYRSNTIKLGWATILATAADPSHMAPEVTSSYERGKNTGDITAADVAWFDRHGPKQLIDRIQIPTLNVQGTVDTLFTLDESVKNYETIRAHGVDTAMMWICSGHGVCLTNKDDPTRLKLRVLEWFKRYLDDDASGETPPVLEATDQHGTSWKSTTWPPAPSEPVSATGTGTLQLSDASHAGPAVSSDVGVIGKLSLPITPARADTALNITVPLGAVPTFVVGAPRLKVNYRGTTPAGDRPTRVFAQLVDDSTGLVVGNQITPIALALDGQTHSADVDLETIAFRSDPGATLTLQLVASTVAYAAPRFGGQVQFDSVDLTLPTTQAMTPAA